MSACHLQHRVCSVSNAIGVTCLAVIAVLMLPGCDDTPDVPPVPDTTDQPAVTSVADVVQTAIRFRDRSTNAGVDFTYRNGEESDRFSIVESLGGGPATLDYDADGHEDLFLPGGGEFSEDSLKGHRSGLYRNHGGWQFSDAGDDAGVSEPRHYSHGTAVGDFDQDGFPDVLVTGYGGLTLWGNNGDGTFSDLTGETGLQDSAWSSSAAWGDLTGDGFLDLYVCHYVNWSFENDPICRQENPAGRDICPPSEFSGLPDSLYVSDGAGGFQDAAKAAGLRADEHAMGLGVLLADIDQDRDLDIYVANDTRPNHLYINDGRGIFSETGLTSGTAYGDDGMANGSMGVDLGDFNQDGLLDLWVANFERESFALYSNRGDNFFQQISQAVGITAAGGLYVGWGTAVFDMDMDGDEDVFVSNGHVERYPDNAPLRQTPLVFESEHGTWFKNVAASAGKYTEQVHNGRGLATGDFDQDGDLDLALLHCNERISLLSNETSPAGHWLQIRLIGRHSARDGVGATVTATTSSGSQLRQRRGGGSYASSCTPRLLFGLGTAVRVDLKIDWPSGITQSIADVPAGQLLTIIEPAQSSQ